MPSHRPLGMRPIYLAADTHTQIALATEKLVLALLVVVAIPKVQDGLLGWQDTTSQYDDWANLRRSCS